MIDVRNLLSLSIFGFFPIFFKLDIRVDIESSVLVLQIDKFRQISTDLWPLIDVINWFSLSIFGISLPFSFKLCMKRSSFKMIFFALKISRGGVCCIPAALLFWLVFAMPLCASVYMCLVVTCWVRADLLALVCVVLL